jgi:hypothetical protein
MALLTFSTEVIGTLELEDLREESIRQFPRLDSGYHYGASESNVTYPEGLLERISLKAKRGHYSGIGTVSDTLDSTTLLNSRRLKTQTNIIQNMIESLQECGKGDYKVTKVITLFNPIKLFVLLSNGNEDEDILYMSINSWSNGSGHRKELNWPEGVPFESKRSRREYFTKRLNKATKERNNLQWQVDNFTGENRNLEWLKSGLKHAIWKVEEANKQLASL